MEETTPLPRKHRQRREANPLLVKELRGRMRGARAFIVITIYLFLLSCLVSVVYAVVVRSSTMYGNQPDMTTVGKTIFATVVIIQIFMVTFITPAFTASAVSGERERKTYEILRTTLLSASRITIGKLSSALTYVVLLILAAVPLQALAFMLGGVTMTEIALALVILLVTAFFFGTLGLFFSSAMRTTLAATVLSYVVALLGTVVLPLILLVFTAFLGIPLVGGYMSNPWPIAVQSIVYSLLYVLVNLSPIGAAIATEVVLLNENSAWLFWVNLDPSHRLPLPSGWIIYTLIFVILSGILLLLATAQIRKQETR